MNYKRAHADFTDVRYALMDGAHPADKCIGCCKT